MLIIAVLEIVAVNIILELCVPKIYYEGFFFFFKKIRNSNLFPGMFDFPSAQQFNGFPQYSIGDFGGEICIHL